MTATHAHQAPRPRQRLPRRVRRHRDDDLPALARRLCDRTPRHRRRRSARRRRAADGVRRPHGAVQRRRQPGRDERQRHPLLRPGARPPARRPRRRRRSSPTPARGASSCARPRTRRRSSPPSTWARSASCPSRRAGQPSAPTPTAPSPTSTSATRTPSSPSTTSPPSTCSRSVARCPTSTSRSSSRARARRHHDARPRARRRHHRGLRHRRRRGGVGGRRWGLVDAPSGEMVGAHGRRRCREWRSTVPEPGRVTPDRPGHLRRPRSRSPTPVSNPYNEALGATLIERTIRERIVLVGVTFPGTDDEDTEASLDELAALIDTAGADEVGPDGAAPRPPRPHVVHRQGQGRGAARAVPRGRRRHRRVRQRAEPGPAVQPGEAARAHGASTAPR